MADLELNFRTLKDEVTKLKRAISEFEIYSNVFVNSTDGILDDCSTEFFTGIETPLNEIRSNKSSKLMEALHKYREHAETAITQLQKKDEEYADRTGGDKNGKQ